MMGSKLKKIGWGGFIIVLVYAWIAAPAWADKKNNTLNMAWEKELETLNRYYQSAREGVILSFHIYDTLLYRDPATGEYKGCLAKSYQWVDDVTIDLELREGITFQNGEKLDADDTVFTINHMNDPKNKVVVARYLNWIKTAEKLGPYKVRIHLLKPFPAALEYLSGPISIYPKDYYLEVGMKKFGVKPIGTGPYQVTDVIPGKAITMVRNKNYFKESPKGQPSIDTIKIRTIPEVNTKIAELMTGGLDWIWRVPIDQANKLEKMPNLNVLKAETMRVGFLYFMQDKPAVKTPFTDARVRKAMAHAIDRPAIVKNLVGGSSRVVHTLCYPAQFGCTDEGVVKYEYNPEKAKKLLAEAGYPNGFDIEFHAYRERPYAEAMIGYLREVGIRAKLVYMKYSALRELSRAHKAPVCFWTWGSSSIYDVSAILGNWMKFTGDDTIRDAEVRDLIEAGDTSIDPEFRKAKYKEAFRLMSERAYVFPLFTWVSNYAFSKDLDFSATADEIPRFFNAKWK